MASIPVILDELPQAEPETLGVLNAGARIKEIDADKLQHSLSYLSEQLSKIFQDIKRVGDFQLKQIQLQAEITAEGGIALIGSTKAGVKGAITLTFNSE